MITDIVSELGLQEIAKSVAKVLLLDFVEDDYPRKPLNPQSIKVSSGGEVYGLLDLVYRNHRMDCELVGANIPLIIALPTVYLEDVKRDLKLRGFDVDSVFWLGEIIFPTMNAGGNISLPNPYELSGILSGGGQTVARIFETSLFSILWTRGIRWFMLGQLWNLGCRINIDCLSWLENLEADGVTEFIERQHIPKSKLLAVVTTDSGTGKEKVICVDERRLRTEQLKQILENSVWSGTGTFWVRLDKIAAAYSLDLTELLNHPGEETLSQKIQESTKDNNLVHRFPDGSVGFSLPLWEMLYSLNMKIEPVLPYRYNACLAPEHP